MKSRVPLCALAVAALCCAVLSLSPPAMAANLNAATTGPTDWTAAGAWVDDAGNFASAPTTGDSAFLGRVVPNAVQPASFDITTTETPDHVYVGWQTADGSTLTITPTGSLTTGQLYAGNNGVNGVITIDGTVVGNDVRAGNGGAAGSVINLNATGSLTTGSMFIGVGGNGTFNHNGGTLSVGTLYPFYSGTGSTLDLNGNNLSVTNISYNGGTGSLIRDGATIAVSGNLQVDNPGSTHTIGAGDTIGTYLRAHNGGILNFNTAVTMASGATFDVTTNGAVLNMNGNDLTVTNGSFRVGQFGSGAATINRGGASISANSFDVRNGPDFTYTDSDSFTNDGMIFNDSVFTLDKNLTLTGTLHVSTNNATLAMGSNDLSVGNLNIGHFGDDTALITRSAGSNISANTVDTRSGSNIDLRADDQINSILQMYNTNSGATVTQLAGDVTGLTLGTTLGTGTLVFGDGTNLLNLIFDAGSGTNDWVFRWANPGVGDRIADITNFINSGNITISGATYDVYDGSDGFTYIGTVVPEPTTLALLAMGGLTCLRRRSMK